MIKDYKFLNRNPQQLDDVIDFFTAQSTNPDFYIKIQEICSASSKKISRPGSESFIKMGYVSINDFLTYMDETGKIGKGINTLHVDIIIQLLVKNRILFPLDSVLAINTEPRFTSSGAFAKLLYDRNLIKNLIFGFDYIIEKYRQSVFKIEQKNQSGDTSIGTGFTVTFGDIKSNIIITNRHVIENCTKIRLLSIDDKELEINEIFKAPEIDIALIKSKDFFDNPFYLNTNLEILSDIITIGYPSIPMSKYAYQVYHKGEVNSFIEDYSNHNLFLISAKTSSGNSGSPIIDKTGMVVGIVTQELFEKEKFYEKGKLPYYAGIPSEEILKGIKSIPQ
jgi:S1-C subfamily serine protease